MHWRHNENSSDCFSDEARNASCNVLIHCQAGVSRSATIVVAYLMHHKKMSMDDAYRLVKAKRSVISPNFNFMGQLMEYEQALKKLTSSEAESSTASGSATSTLSKSGARKPKILSIETSLWKLHEKTTPDSVGVETTEYATFSLERQPVPSLQRKAIGYESGLVAFARRCYGVRTWMNHRHKCRLVLATLAELLYGGRLCPLIWSPKMISV